MSKLKFSLQRFLNKPEKVGFHAVLCKIELSKLGYFEHSNLIITGGQGKIASLPMDLDTEEAYFNTMHSLEVLITSLTEVKNNLPKLIVEKNLILEAKSKG